MKNKIPKFFQLDLQKEYYVPQDIEVIQNRNTSKILITNIYENRPIKPISFELVLKTIPCRNETRFWKLYEYYLLNRIQYEEKRRNELSFKIL